MKPYRNLKITLNKGDVEMEANKTKGITIHIGADATVLSQELGIVEKQIDLIIAKLKKANNLSSQLSSGVCGSKVIYHGMSKQNSFNLEKFDDAIKTSELALKHAKTMAHALNGVIKRNSL